MFCKLVDFTLFNIKFLLGEKQVEFHIKLIASILFKMALCKSAFLMSHDCRNIEKDQGIYFLNTEKMLSNGMSWVNVGPCA